jgi:Kef-type K+ transport system membrane component KefB
LATATLHDVILWVALAIATGLVNSESISLAGITATVLITVIFLGISLLVMPKIVRFGSNLRYNFLMRSSTSGYVLFVCFLFSALASILDVNIVFGALLAGMVIGVMPHEQFAKAKEHIRDISLAFFVPIYFAIIGLRLDLIQHLDILFSLQFLLFATTFAVLGTLIALRLAKEDWLSSFNLAVAMNARGGPLIVLATVALELGIINQTFFVTLILIALSTSLLAGSWFKYVISKGLPLLKDERPEQPGLIPHEQGQLARSGILITPDGDQ